MVHDTYFKYLFIIYQNINYFHAFVIIGWLFSKLFLFQILFQEHYQSVKRFEYRSGPTFCQIDLDPNCLQRLSADLSRH